MAGRPKGSKNSYKPFRQKKDGVEYGSFRVWVPRERKVVTLDTEIFTEAVQKAKELIGGISEERIPDENQPAERVEQPRPEISGGAPSGIPAGRILSDWASLGNPTPQAPEVVTPPAASDPSGTDNGFRVIPGGASEPPRAVAKPKAQKGLTPEQAEKLGRGLTKIVTKLNAVGAEMCVRMLGRDPYPLDEDDFALIELGWELFIAEHFGKSQPKAWHVILAGNAMILFAMYVRGTPIPQITEDKSGLKPL